MPYGIISTERVQITDKDTKGERGTMYFQPAVLTFTFSYENLVYMFICIFALNHIM